MNTRRDVEAKSRVETNRWIRHGILGGIVAGIVFLIGEILISLVMSRNLLDSLRLIGSMVLGTQALQPTYPLLAAAGVGFIVHMSLSMLYGVIFFFLLSFLRQINNSLPGFLIFGMAYGLFLWIFNFLLIAPVIFPQLTTVNPFWNLFFVHTFLYGLVIGAYAAILYSVRMETKSALPVTGKDGEK